MAILKQFVLGHKLKKFQWVGVGWNVVSIVLVGYTALLSMGDSPDPATAEGPYSDSMFGVMLILAGAFVQSLQYAFEERVMSMDLGIPPLLLIGMEGLWGTLVCVCVLYPICYSWPGSDHGSIENPYNTYTMFMNSSEIQHIFILYFIFIFAYNVLACLVTFMLNSIWHAILDNFRPISVWGTDLFIFYNLSQAYGEAWTVYSYIQLLGLFVLLYGTAVYNAPNDLSIKLTGKWYDFFLDCSDEYREADDENEDKRLNGEATFEPPFNATMSPFMKPSPRQTALRNSPRTKPAAAVRSYGGVDNNKA